MEPEDEFGDDEPVRPPLPPDDRLWRHPSEMAGHPPAAPLAGPESRGSGLRMLPVALLSGAIGALLATGVLIVTGPMRTETVRTVVQRETSSSGGSVSAGAGIVEVAEKTKPAIVEVHAASQGAGVVVRSDGHIVTSARVVGDQATARVVLPDGEEEKGEVVGRDLDTDMAVLKVERSGMNTAALGSAAGLKEGQVAIVVGTGVSLGVISKLGREVRLPDGKLLLDMIETDAPVPPTSSGGALVDGAGAVIGIATSVDGTGYATPVDVARDVAEQLMATGTVAHAWLGVEGGDLDAEDSGRLGIEGGALVRRVRDGSPAALAGLLVRDVIMAVDGTTVQSMSALKSLLRGRRPGQVVDLTLMRDGKETRLLATLAPRPAS